MRRFVIELLVTFFAVAPCLGNSDVLDYSYEAICREHMLVEKASEASKQNEFLMVAEIVDGGCDQIIYLMMARKGLADQSTLKYWTNASGEPFPRNEENKCPHLIEQRYSPDQILLDLKAHMQTLYDVKFQPLEESALWLHGVSYDVRFSSTHSTSRISFSAPATLEQGIYNELDAWFRKLRALLGISCEDAPDVVGDFDGTEDPVPE